MALLWQCILCGDLTSLEQLETKYSDKARGTLSFRVYREHPLAHNRTISHIILASTTSPSPSNSSSSSHTRTNHDRPYVYFGVLIKGITPGTHGTLTWSTLNALDAKLELDNNIANGLKVEALSTFLPATNSTSAKVNIHFKQPAFHFRAFVDLLKGPTATVDFVTGHEGFLVGGEAGYDVQKAAVTRYSAAIGFTQDAHNAAIVASNNLSVFAASYYNRVNKQVEVGAKATWDSKTSSAVGLELASKYVIDPLSFAKAKVDDRGIAALSYNVKVKEGFTFGLGASFDTQKLNEATHKVGVKFAFEG